jgi:hypothetical protein
MTPKKILVADDSALVRKVLWCFLETQTQFTVCGEAWFGRHRKSENPQPRFDCDGLVYASHERN